jgi:hypothetical protein
MSTSVQPFRALYYPYSRCLNEVDLKRSLLVFDQLLFVDPLSGDISEHPGQSPVYNPMFEVRSDLDNPESRFSHRASRWLRRSDDRLPAWYDVTKTYDQLSKQGIARLVTPRDHLQAVERVVKYAVLRDLAQEVGQYYGQTFRFWSEHRPYGWKLHVSRLPNGLIELKNEEELLRSAITGSLDQEERKENKEKEETTSRRLKDLKEALDIISQARDRAKGEELILPFGIAQSLILNQALLLCDELQAFPVTDDPVAHKALVHKIELVHKSSKELLGEQGLLPEPTAPDLYRIQFFTLGVVSRLVPDQARKPQY